MKYCGTTADEISALGLVTANLMSASCQLIDYIFTDPR